MTTTADAASLGRGARLRRWAPWLAIALGLVALGALLPRGGDDLPLSPRSAAPDGTKGLVDVLDELASAEVGTDLEGAGTALLLRDRLDDAGRDELLRWVEAGGVLVVTDPGSPVTRVRLAPFAGGGIADTTLERRCDEPALRGAERVVAPSPVLFAVGAGERGCFTSGEGAWLLLQPVGEGTVVRLGGATGFVNGRLDDADNAVVAASLLAPTPGTRAVVLDEPLPSGGQQSLTDLVHPRVRAALLQLGAAFVVLAAWRARRLGRPVAEPQPVSIPASELVVAVGNLFQRSRRRDRAAAVLSEELRRTLCERLGLPRSLGDEGVAAAAAARTGIAPDRVLAALRARPADEAGLVAHAHTVESIRQEVLSAR